ncbi:MAG TPA: hypothetical protein VGN75_18710 [Kaistia sp.]|jgi:hypothetical protein|nr:hypothetical protein [Kaistia sp.]
MTRLLDLDNLPTREDYALVLNGARHVMQPLSVGNFIAQQKRAKELEGNTDPAVEFAALVDMVASVFPTMPRGDLDALPVNKITAIYEFVVSQGKTPDEAGSAGE